MAAIIAQGSHLHASSSETRRKVLTSDALRLHLALPARRTPKQTFRHLSLAPPRRHAPLFLPRSAAAADGDTPPPPPTASILDEEWNILNAPGLNPPRSQTPKTDRMSRTLRSMHAAAAAVFPPLSSAELLRRLGVTIAAIWLVRVGHHIPVPGVDFREGFGDQPMSMTAQLTGSSELPGNVYLLGIAPYMTARFFLTVVGQVFPSYRRHLKSLNDQGRSGREVVNGYVNVLFVLFAAAQAYIESGNLLAFAKGAWPPFWERTAIGLSLMAGAVVCKWAMLNVDTFGLGDGAGVVIGTGIALAYSKQIALITTHLLAHPPPVLGLLASFGLCWVTVAIVAWVHGTELRLPLTFLFSRRAGRRAAHPVLLKLSGVDAQTALATQQLLPLRLSPVGTRSLLFANFWMGLLQGPLTFVGLGSLLQNPFAWAGFVFLLEAISVADATPRQAADFLAQNNTCVKGLSPGVDTERFFMRRLRQMKVLNAAFLAGVSLAARGVDWACAQMIGVPLGCLNLLLLVSTVLGGARQVDALTRVPLLERKIAVEYAVVEEAVAQRSKPAGEK